MTKKKENHLMGKHTGYELVDGVYHIAPMYTDNFKKLAARSAGIDQLLKSVTRHAAEISSEIATEQQKLWEMIQDDLGLDASKTYLFQQDGTVRMGEEKTK